MKLGYKSILLSAAALLSGLPAVLAGDEYIADTCQSAIGNYMLDCGLLEYYPCRCKNNIFTSSVIKCMYTLTDKESVVEDAMSSWIGYCEEYGDVVVTFKEIYGMYEEDVANNNFTFTKDLTNVTLPLTTPVIFTSTEIQSALKTVKTFNWELYSGTLFGGIMMAYWGGVIFIGTLINLMQHVAPKVMLSMNRPVFIKFRQAFTIPATFGFKHSIPMSFLKVFSMATPTRGQSMALLGYFILNIILFFVKFDLFLPNSYFATFQYQILRYLADRTGVIAFVHFPALFLFGGRNNLMMWATGWSFDTFNVYHRWIARGMVLHAFLHSVAYSIMVALEGYYKEEFEEPYWVWGVCATVLCCIILGQSIHFLRSRWYEAFLVIHIIFAAVFLVCCYYHCWEMGWLQWMWASVAIWAFDRAVRLGRLAWSGFGKAESKLYSNDIFKMTINYSGRWKYYPGCHIYFHVMRPWGFWESHPFTLYQHPDPAQKDKLILCGTAKEGMTRKIYNDLAKAGGEKNITLLLDGPYGHRLNLQHYDTCVFVAGGIGITATYAYAADLLSRSDMKQNVIFIWITRHESALEWFSEEIKSIAQSERCTTEIFITKSGQSPSGSDTEFSSSKEKNSDSDSLPITPLPIVRGVRPDIYELVASHIQNSIGATSVMVCGPPTLNDTTRRCVADNLGNGKGRVDYLEESFSW